jgi:hypothetical protein
MGTKVVSKRKQAARDRVQRLGAPLRLLEGRLQTHNATVIQSFFRGWSAREKVKKEMSSIIIVQKWWKERLRMRRAEKSFIDSQAHLLSLLTNATKHLTPRQLDNFCSRIISSGASSSFRVLNHMTHKEGKKQGQLMSTHIIKRIFGSAEEAKSLKEEVERLKNENTALEEKMKMLQDQIENLRQLHSKNSKLNDNIGEKEFRKPWSELKDKDSIRARLNFLHTELHKFTENYLSKAVMSHLSLQQVQFLYDGKEACLLFEEPWLADDMETEEEKRAFERDSVIRAEVKQEKLHNLVHLRDVAAVSQHATRLLTSNNLTDVRSYELDATKLKQNREMQKILPISNIDFTKCHSSSSKATKSTISATISSSVSSHANASCDAKQRRLKDLLNIVLPPIVATLQVGEKIRLKVSGDGRNCGRKVKHTLITICVMNEGKLVMMPDKQYSVVMYAGPEDIDLLKPALHDFLLDLEDIQEHGWKHQDKTFPVELFFTADWKFMYICQGMKAPIADLFCLWCECPKKDRWDMSKNWVISKDKEHFAKIMEWFSRKKGEIGGHVRMPLFSMIDAFHCVIDVLHLFLRITDVLFELLIEELIEQADWDVRQKLVFMEMKRIGVTFYFWKTDKGGLNYTSLQGPDKLKLMKSFRLDTIFPNNKERAKKIQSLWDNFMDLYDTMSQYHPSDDSINSFQSRAKAWVSEFLTPSSGKRNSSQYVRGLYCKEDVTPYMHAMVFHVPEFLQLYRGIRLFSCESLEKKNHVQVLSWFRCSRKGGGRGRGSSLLELLEKENRMLYAELYLNNKSLKKSKRKKTQTKRLYKPKKKVKTM